MRGIVRRFNPELEGRVSGGNKSRTHMNREAELLAFMQKPTADIAPDTSDHFVGHRFSDSQVSLENAAAYEEGVSDYDAGFDITGQAGILPCDLVGRPRESKVGASGKMRWSR